MVNVYLNGMRIANSFWEDHINFLSFDSKVPTSSVAFETFSTVMLIGNLFFVFFSFCSVFLIFFIPCF